MSLEKATLGSGCFWCYEHMFKQLKGVDRVISGYAGGHVEDPTYKQVCNGNTGHAEVYQITYDSDVISFGDLLDIFFTVHNPTTKNRQGNDIGPQYRSIILYHNDQQKEVAHEKIEEFNKKGLWDDPIVTEVEPLNDFYEAEDYHQDYYANNPNQSYCKFVIEPKVQKFRKKYMDRLKA